MSAAIESRTINADAPLTRTRAILARETSGAQTLIVAFSGGADSVLTAYLAAEIAKQRSQRLVLWYFHHYTTPVERERLKIFSAALSALPVKAELVQAGANVEKISRRLGYSWEHTASLLRRKYLLRSCREIPGSIVLLGHHYSDYAETLALRQQRKIPAVGLPLLTVRDTVNGFLRPLYSLTRHQVRALVTSQKLPYYDDPANTDPKFARNRVRQTLPDTAQAPPTNPAPPALPVFAASEKKGKGRLRELYLSKESWQTLTKAEKARSLFDAFRRLAVARKFTRGDFARAHKLPFALPPFFAHCENDAIVFRRGLGANVSLPLPVQPNFLRGDAVTRKNSLRQKYGHKSLTKIFSEKKISPRERRRTLVYLQKNSLSEAAYIVFADNKELRPYSG